MPDTEFAPDLNEVERQPTTVDDARDQIYETRERISATLDQIESRIVDTKQELRRKADVLRPARERIRLEPWKALAIAAGVGLALGLLTGGHEKRSPKGRRTMASRHRRSRGAIASGPTGRGIQHKAEEWRDELEDDLHDSRDAIASAGRKLKSKAEDWRDEIEDEVHDQDVKRPARRGPEFRERVAHHLLRSLAGAISDGVSSRLRHAAMS